MKRLRMDAAKMDCKRENGENQLQRPEILEEEFVRRRRGTIFLKVNVGGRKEQLEEMVGVGGII